MGYIAPVTPFQYIQYGNRVAYTEERKEASQPVKGTKPVFHVLLHAKKEEQLEDLNRQEYENASRSFKKPVYHEQKFVSVPRITGKGLLLDHMI